ncbi:hypothetical protein QE152_g16050 [Popillia japonica]|uniref:Uncharacterized protein n=1 Tax=Popillia japonica TaxID=7064 RepID=A0AAW1L5X5_POPJA
MLPAVAFVLTQSVVKVFETLCETDVEFALKLRMLPAVAFVLTQSVVKVFETLCENEIFPLEAQEVVDYFEDTWIGRPQRRQRRPPQFDLDMWKPG